jgi:hypothetical protein
MSRPPVRHVPEVTMPAVTVRWRVVTGAPFLWGRNPDKLYPLRCEEGSGW